MNPEDFTAARQNGSSYSELAGLSGHSDTEVRRIIATRKTKTMRFDDTKLAIVSKPNESDLVARLGSIHERIGKNLRAMQEDAIEAGRILTEQKGKLRHGDWLPWLKTNQEKLGFNKSWAEVYMGCYRHRDLANSHSGGNMTIKQLAKGGKTKVSEPKPEVKPKPQKLEFLSRNGKVRITNPPKTWRVAKYAAIEDHPALIVCTKCWHYSQGSWSLEDIQGDASYECKCPDGHRKAKLLEERK